MQADNPESPPYIDDPNIREVFADHPRVVVWDGHNMRIELAVARPEAVGPNQSKASLHTAVRLVMPPATAGALRDILTQVLGQLEQQGVLKRLQPAPGTKQ